MAAMCRKAGLNHSSFIRSVKGITLERSVTLGVTLSVTWQCVFQAGWALKVGQCTAFPDALSNLNCT